MALGGRETEAAALFVCQRKENKRDRDGGGSWGKVRREKERRRKDQEDREENKAGSCSKACSLHHDKNAGRSK